MDLNSKNVCIVALFVSVVLFIFMVGYVWHFTVDDAFISFRYSEHLANGFGLVWDIGQPPVEGYTNFLWVLIIAFLFLLKLDPVFLTKIIGLLSVLGIIILFWLITNDIFKDMKDKSIAFTVSTTFLLINPYTAIHAVSGLETMLFAFLLLGVMYSTWKIIISPNSKFIWFFAFTALLLSLTRPEGMLVSLGLIFSIIIITYKKNNNSIKLTSYLPVLILYLIPIVIYNVFRVFYFHGLFPLPFLAKMVHSTTYPLYFLIALIYLIPFAIIILISLYLINQKIDTNRNQLKTNFKYFLLILGITLSFAIIVYVYTPNINFAQRFFYPSFVLIYAAFGIAINILFHEIGKNKTNIKSAKNTRIIFSSVIILTLLVFTNFIGVNELVEQHNYGDSLNNAHIPLGKTLSSFSEDNYTIFCGDAGSIAYYSGWNLLDGLNDKFIAQNGVTTEYLKEKHPELVIFISYNQSIDWTNPPIAEEKYVLENNYTQLIPIKFNDNYYLIPFLKPNIKDYNLIKISIENVAKESSQTSV
jgi:arabinofuranosyltransferase